MSASYHPNVSMISRQVASNSTADVATFNCPFNKAEVIQAFVDITTTSAHATAFILKFDLAPCLGSTTGRGDGDVAVLKKTAGISEQGKRIYKDLQSSHITWHAGEAIVAEITTAQGEAAAIDVGLIVREVDEVPGNIPMGTAGTSGGMAATAA